MKRLLSSAFLNQKQGAWLAALLLMVVLVTLVIAPLFTIITYDKNDLTWGILQDDYIQWRIVWTFSQALVTCGVTAVLSLPLAWVISRFQFFGRRLLLKLLLLPFVMPTLVAGMGVLALLGPNGYLGLDLTDTPWLLIYGNIFFNLPIMVRAVLQGFNLVPANRLAAARSLGATAWQAFYWVSLPVIRPWLAGAMCLVFLYCFSGFGLALVLGGMKYSTVEVEIYQLIAYELNMASASILALLMLVGTAAAALLYAWISSHSLVPLEQIKVPLKLVKTYREKLMVLLTVLFLMMCCAAPLIAVFLQAIMAGDSWLILKEEQTWLAIGNSIRFSLMALMLATVLGVLHATWAHRLRLGRITTFLPFMVSPVVMTFGLLILYPDWTASLGILIAAYTLLAYPFITKDVLSLLDTLPEKYAAASRNLGANFWQTQYWVIFPLLRPALRRGMTFAAATCVGEFAATLFLSRPEWLTLTTLIYQLLGRAGQANYQAAMVLSLLLMLIAGAIFMLLDDRASHE